MYTIAIFILRIINFVQTGSFKINLLEICSYSILKENIKIARMEKILKSIGKK